MPDCPTDKARKPGFYWVQLGDRLWTIAEWDPEGHQDGKPTWYLTGSDAPRPSSEVAEVDERRIVRTLLAKE